MTEEKLEFVSLVSDTTFKYLYKSKDTKKWFDNIIKNLFNIDLEDYEIVDNESNTGNNIKDYRMDIKLKHKYKDITVIIEMNKEYYDFLESKNYQYLYREAGSIYDTGERYGNKLTKLILFNNFKNKKSPEIKNGNYIFEDPINKIVIDDIESFEIYLPNYKKLCYDSSEIEVSLSLFTATSFEEMRKLTRNSKDIKIIEELERLAMDNEFKINYDQEAVKRKTENSIREESYSKGIERGIKQGIEQGTKDSKLEIAKNMLKDNISIELISKFTGLSVEEIESLK